MGCRCLSSITIPHRYHNQANRSWTSHPTSSHNRRRGGEICRNNPRRFGSCENSGSVPWRGFLIFRESGADLVLRHLNTLPLASYFNFDLTELDTAFIR